MFVTKMVHASSFVGRKILANLLLVLATQAIANVVKTSFGPSGLDKMMVDDIGVWVAVWSMSKLAANEQL
jgi:chaperonin GroEL (HSP60 family)